MLEELMHKGKNEIITVMMEGAGRVHKKYLKTPLRCSN